MMVRKGEEEGRVLLVMDDGTRITRKVTPNGVSRAVVRDPSGKPVPAPQGYLDALAPALNFNPAAFVEADGKARIRMLTEAFPVRASKEQIESLVGGVIETDDLPESLNLQQVSEIYRRAYQARTEANGQLRQIRTEREAELSRVPEGFDPEKVRGVSTRDLAEELARVETHNRHVAEVRRNLERLKGNERDLERQIEELKARLAQVREKSGEAERWLKENPEKPSADLQKRIEALDEQRAILAHQDRAKRLLEQEEEVEKRVKRLDAGVKRLRALPAELAESADIPIPGLTIEEKDIHVNGLPFGNLSDGQKIQVAVQVARAGAKDLKILCVDGAEKLSADVRDKMVEDLRKSGFQVFMTVTDNDDLRVRDIAPSGSENTASGERAGDGGVSVEAVDDGANGKWYDDLKGTGEESEESVDLDRYFEEPPEEKAGAGKEQEFSIDF